MTETMEILLLLAVSNFLLIMLLVLGYASYTAWRLWKTRRN